MDAYNHKLMETIDKQYLKTPFYGSRKMVIYLTSEGYFVNRKRVQRLMRLMNIQAVYPKPNLSKNRQEHKIYPYLLKGVKIDRPNFVWSTDITYIPVSQGFLYLAAIIDWYSRYVLSWYLSNTLYEDVYLKGYETGKDVKEGLSAYFPFYNNERFHQALGYRTPKEVHYN
jgi:putative transposase